MESAAKQKQPIKWRKTALQFVLGGLAGGVASWTVDRYGWGEHLEDLGWSAIIGGSLGLIYVIAGTLLTIGSVSPKIGAVTFNVEDEQELHEERPLIATAGAASAMMGVALIILCLSGAGGLIGQPIALGFAVASTIIGVAASIYQFRYMDELMQDLTKETAVWSYYLVSTFGFGWAVLAHLNYLPAPTPLAWINLFYGAVLVAAVIANAKRGLLTPR